MKIKLEPSGCDLLDRVESVLRTYVVLPSDDDYVAVALWIVATHALPAFETAPRLVVRSARKRSGKTRLMEIIEQLSHDASRVALVSDAVMYRGAGGEHPKTFLIDEADTLFGPATGTSRESLRGIVNSGFERGAYVPRMAGAHTRQVVEFETFAMVALAGIGEMPDTIEDRAIVIVMRPRQDSERVSPFRRADRDPLKKLKVLLAQWAQQEIETLSDRAPDIPVEDRAADLWLPLLAIADQAGGAWPDRARQACLALTDRHRINDIERSPSLRLLADVRSVFERTGSAFIGSAEICSQLEDIDPIWASPGFTTHKLANMLRPYGVKPVQSPDRRTRGYLLLELKDVFERYLD